MYTKQRHQICISLLFLFSLSTSTPLSEKSTNAAKDTTCKGEQCWQTSCEMPANTDENDDAISCSLTKKLIINNINNNNCGASSPSPSPECVNCIGVLPDGCCTTSQHCCPARDGFAAHCCLNDEQCCGNGCCGRPGTNEGCCNEICCPSEACCNGVCCTGGTCCNINGNPPCCPANVCEAGAPFCCPSGQGLCGAQCCPLGQCQGGCCTGQTSCSNSNSFTCCNTLTQFCCEANPLGPVVCCSNGDSGCDSIGNCVS